MAKTVTATTRARAIVRLLVVQLPFMSEVPFLDSSCLGPDLTTLNEDDLLRYFLNDDLEHSPFDSKVPNSSPLLEPPTISLVSPLPKQTTQPVVTVKKEHTSPVKSTTAAKRAKTQAPTPSTKPPIQATPAPPSSTSAPTSKVFTSTQPKHAKPSTHQIHPITVNATQSSHDSTAIQIPKGIVPPPSPLPSPSVSPLPSPSSPVPDDDKAVKRQRRLLKNRESAQLSRIRKKMYIDELERKVNALVSENTGLREEVVHLNDVLKQVAVTEGENGTKAPLSRSEIMRAISSTNTSSSQARKYAGVCLLVVLFSLGLFLNTAPTGTSVQMGNRFIELDSSHNHHGSKNNSSSSNNNNNSSVDFRDYKLTKSTNSVVSGGRKEKSAESDDESDSQSFSGKRSWDDGDDYISSPSPKRLRNDSTSMVTDIGDVEGERDPLFDVLEDDAFSEDGILTTSSSPASIIESPPLSPFSSPQSPATPISPSTALVPSTPPVPLVGPTTPPQVSLNSSQTGLAVLVPSVIPASSPLEEPLQVVHIHLWTILRSPVM